MQESEKWKWSCSVVPDSQRPHGLQPTRLLRPWDFPGKSTGVGFHCLLRQSRGRHIYFFTCNLWFPYESYSFDQWFQPHWHFLGLSMQDIFSKRTTLKATLMFECEKCFLNVFQIMLSQTQTRCYRFNWTHPPKHTQLHPCGLLPSVDSLYVLCVSVCVALKSTKWAVTLYYGKSNTVELDTSCDWSQHGNIIDFMIVTGFLTLFEHPFFFWMGIITLIELLLRTGGEGGDRGWDGWMAPPTQ